MKMIRVETRDLLLDAALRLLGSQNMNLLTLDNVAKEAGVSKGGLLHHFKSKEALIEALLLRLFRAFEGRVEHYYAIETDTAGRWLRAYVMASFDDDHLPMELTLFLLTSITENERLRTVVQAYYNEWAARLFNDGIPRARAMLIQQATDSYWIDRSLGIMPNDLVAEAELVEELRQLASTKS